MNNDVEVIIPKKNHNENKNKSILAPIVYLGLGLILAFKSDEAVQLLFYVIGAIIIVFGVKSLVEYNRHKELAQYKSINLSVGITSLILGVLLITLAGAITLSIRYIIGFFLIFIGLGRILNQISYGVTINFSAISNIILIILGFYSIFVSNAVLMIIGWILIANAILLFVEYIRK